MSVLNPFLIIAFYMKRERARSASGAHFSPVLLVSLVSLFGVDHNFGQFVLVFSGFKLFQSRSSFCQTHKAKAVPMAQQTVF